MIGLLPASGKASRIGGLPKFCLPISEEDCLLSWHVKCMKIVCEEVWVCTSAKWASLVQNLNLDIKLMIKEPSTMNDAILYMNDSEDCIVGMPDTYMANCENPYKYFPYYLKDSDICLGLWNCPIHLRGKVGQIEAVGNIVKNSIDKFPNCEYKHMWGNMLIRGSMLKNIDKYRNHPGEQLQQWIDSKKNITCVYNSGKYIDAGTFSGFSEIFA
jgi:hypothetical protein